MAPVAHPAESKSWPSRSGAGAAARLAAAIRACLAVQAIVFMLGAPIAAAQEGPKSAAVLPFEAFSFAQVPAARMTALFRDALNETKAFGLIKTGAEVDKACLDLPCALGVAKQVKANFVVFSRLSELDPDHWLITAALASADNSEMIRAATIEQTGSPTTLFPDALNALAKKLIGLRGASGERRVALFPTLTMGGDASFPRDAMNVYVEAARTLPYHVPTVSFAYVFNEPVLKALAGSTSKSRNIISLQENHEISSESWSGILDRVPNMEFALKKCEELDVDLIVFAKFFPRSGPVQHFRFSGVDCNLRTMNEKEGPFFLQSKIVYSSSRSNLQRQFKSGEEDVPLRAAMVELLKQ
jgi:hypothetical protein